MAQRVATLETRISDIEKAHDNGTGEYIDDSNELHERFDEVEEKPSSLEDRINAKFTALDRTTRETAHHNSYLNVVDRFVERARAIDDFIASLRVGAQRVVDAATSRGRGVSGKRRDEPNL